MSYYMDNQDLKALLTAHALATRILVNTGDAEPILMLRHLTGFCAHDDLDDAVWAILKDVVKQVKWNGTADGREYTVRSWRNHHWLNKDGRTWEASFNEHTGVWTRPVAAAVAEKYCGYFAEVPGKEVAEEPKEPKPELGEALGQAKAALDALGEALKP